MLSHCQAAPSHQKSKLSQSKLSLLIDGKQAPPALTFGCSGTGSTCGPVSSCCGAAVGDAVISSHIRTCGSGPHLPANGIKSISERAALLCKQMLFLGINLAYLHGPVMHDCTRASTVMAQELPAHLARGGATEAQPSSTTAASAATCGGTRCSSGVHCPNSVLFTGSRTALDGGGTGWGGPITADPIAEEGGLFSSAAAVMGVGWTGQGCGVDSAGGRLRWCRALQLATAEWA